VKHFFDHSKPVASVCHGIELVAAAGVLRGRTATTVRKCRYDIEFSGGKYVDEPVVIDGNLITARTWHDNTPFLHEFVRLLQGQAVKVEKQ
jgi:protease I